jgi:hypothetical protein
MVTDLSNEIPLDAAAAEGLRSPGQPETPTPVLVDADVPKARGRNLAVKIPTSVTARTDSFIDDLIRIFLDTIENRRLQPHAVPLAVHVANRPNAGPDEPIPHRENLSGAKLEAEGTPAEVQIVLGWEIDTRRLMIRLTFDKFVAWSADLTDVILAGRATIGALQTLVGCLNHAAYVILLSRHFLGRLRQRLHINQSARQHLSFSKDELADLQLWTKFLHSAREGISLNSLTLRQPSQIGLSDSCPFGMGGFTWTGRAWRLRIPKPACFTASPKQTTSWNSSPWPSRSGLCCRSADVSDSEKSPFFRLATTTQPSDGYFGRPAWIRLPRTTSPSSSSLAR